MNAMQFLHEVFQHFVAWADLDFWEAMFAGGAALFVLVVYRLHRSTDTQFRFQDFFSDEVTGKGSTRKLLGFGAFLVHSWLTARYCVYTPLADVGGDRVVNLVVFYGLLWAGVLMLGNVLNTLADGIAAKLGARQAATPPT